MHVPSHQTRDLNVTLLKVAFDASDPSISLLLPMTVRFQVSNKMNNMELSTGNTRYRQRLGASGKQRRPQLSCQEKGRDGQQLPEEHAEHRRCVHFLYLEFHFNQFETANFAEAAANTCPVQER